MLTAHPTQVTRRTLQYKHTRIASCLERNDRPDLSPEERETVIEEIVREVTSLWKTDELRRRKPTPVRVTFTCELRVAFACCVSSIM